MNQVQLWAEIGEGTTFGVFSKDATFIFNAKFSVWMRKIYFLMGNFSSFVINFIKKFNEFPYYFRYINYIILIIIILY